MHQLRRESFGPGRSGGDSQPYTGARDGSDRAGAACIFGRMRQGVSEFGTGANDSDAGDGGDGKLSGHADAYVHAAGTGDWRIRQFRAAWTNQRADTYYLRRAGLN